MPIIVASIKTHDHAVPSVRRDGRGQSSMRIVTTRTDGLQRVLRWESTCNVERVTRAGRIDARAADPRAVGRGGYRARRVATLDACVRCGAPAAARVPIEPMPADPCGAT